MPIRPVFPDDQPFKISLENLGEKDLVMLVTGVANPRSLVERCTRYPFRTRVMHFSDHHNFSRKDIEKIATRYAHYKGARKLILTTEKDAGRLLHNPYFPQELKPYTFSVPLQVEMMNDWIEGSDFINDLTSEIARVKKRKENEINRS